MLMKNRRFSKQNVIALIEAHIEDLSKKYDFKDGDGTNSVLNTGHDQKIAFGRFDAYRDLLEDLQ